MRKQFTLMMCVAALASAPKLTAADELYTESGETPTWESLLESGKVVPGEKPGSRTTFKGSRINVNNSWLKSKMGHIRSTVQPDRIHTHVDSTVNPDIFGDYTRWYQEDKNTQVFRLFGSEQSVRSLDNIKAGRIEAVKSYTISKPGEWVEWEGTYTIIKPTGAAIFQLLTEKNPKTGKGGLWAMHIGMSKDGDIGFQHRQAPSGEPRNVTIAEDAVGKPVRIKVRYNGTDYEVFRKIHGTDADFVPVAKGSYPPTYENRGHFRWGMYSGSKPGSEISNDAMLFVTGIEMR